jgi:hypothetical protein
MTKVMANSPAVLEGYLGFGGALGNGHLDAKTSERLDLITASKTTAPTAFPPTPPSERWLG